MAGAKFSHELQSCATFIHIGSVSVWDYDFNVYNGFLVRVQRVLFFPFEYVSDALLFSGYTLQTRR